MRFRFRKPAEVTAFYTYGTSLNVEGIIRGVSKDNLEGMRLLITDGANYEKSYNLRCSFSDGNVVFSSKDLINRSIELDELEIGKYYILIRMKANNSKDFKYYTLSNTSQYKDIEYYTLTKESKNNKIDIKFSKDDFKGTNYSYLGLTVSQANLPDDVYDIVVDPGHGGRDSGETSDGESESRLMLEYGKSLKEALEAKGYKVKLTRDDSNNDSFTDMNMYDDGGRIDIACKTKAKYMISLHTAESGYSGIQVFAPNNVDFTLAEKLSNNIYNVSSLNYSGSNDYKIKDGIYQKNYNKDSIERVTKNLEKQGIEPYNLTANTPALYTIREVGGLATNAYVDGRNPNYSANKHYNSNQGIECYQISIGSLKYEKEVLQAERDQIVNAIAECF